MADRLAWHFLIIFPSLQISTHVQNKLLRLIFRLSQFLSYIHRLRNFGKTKRCAKPKKWRPMGKGHVKGKLTNARSGPHVHAWWRLIFVHARRTRAITKYDDVICAKTIWWRMYEILTTTTLFRNVFFSKKGAFITTLFPNVRHILFSLNKSLTNSSYIYTLKKGSPVHKTPALCGVRRRIGPLGVFVRRFFL
jgi:hypothetical protein